MHDRVAWAQSWEMRLVAWLPLPPVLSGLLLTALLLAVYAFVEPLFGRGAEGAAEDGLVGFTVNQLGLAVAALGAGYALAVSSLIHAGNSADLEALRPAFENPGAGVGSASHVSLRASRACGALGILCGILFAYWVDESAAALLRLEGFTTDGLLSLVAVPLAFWLSARAAYFTLAGLDSVARAVQAHLAIDLLDPDRLAPLGRMALRAALLWIGAAAIGSLSVVLSGVSVAESIAITVFVLIAIGAFLIPVRGLHRKIRQVKQAELAELRDEIRRDREAVRRLAGERGPGRGRLPRAIGGARPSSEGLPPAAPPPTLYPLAP